jgi:Flp pilus assembly protein TadD
MNSRAWCLLAAAHFGNGQYQEAADSASRAVELAPSDEWPYRLLSSAQRQLGNIAAAVTAANEACKLAPNEWRPYACLAQAQLASLQGLADAEVAVINALRLGPDEPDVHFIAGKVAFRAGQLKAARAHQERVLALDPAYSEALNELGRIRLRHANHGGAARLFIEAAKSAPGVNVYGQNVDVVVRRVVSLTIYVASVASFALMYLTTTARLTRVSIVLGYVMVIVLSAGFGAVQVWRMPRPARPLFRSWRVALAIGAVYGAICVAGIVAVVTPRAALSGAAPPVTLLIVASRFVAFAILRRRSTARPTGT